jgi:hypothetical protein
MSQPLFEPDSSPLGIFDGVSAQFMWTRNHHDRNSKLARCFDLRIGRRSARVFGNKHINLLLPEKCRLSPPVERSSVKHQPDIGRQRDIVRRVDRAREIVMMWTLGEGAELDAAKTQKNTTWLRPQRVSCGFRARDGKPPVAWSGLPGRAHDRGKRDRKPCARGYGVGRDLIGVRVRCVNDRVYFFLLQPCNKAVGAAEAADPRSNGLHFGVRGAPGKGDSRLKAWVGRKQTRQVRGLRGTSKDKNAHQGHLHGC